jgi:hypothetical protein
MNKNFSQLIRPLLIIFIFITVLVFIGKTVIEKKGIDQVVLLAGNLVLFLTTLASSIVSWKAFNSANPQASVRGMYGSFMIKFFVIAIAAFIYIITAKEKVNKAGLIACAGLYIVYSYIEVAALTRMLKQRKNA